MDEEDENEDDESETEAPLTEADVLKQTVKRLNLLVEEGRNQTKELYKIAKEARKKAFEKCQ